MINVVYQSVRLADYYHLPAVERRLIRPYVLVWLFVCLLCVSKISQEL